MLVAGYVKDDFIKDSLKCSKKELKKIFDDFQRAPYIIFIKHPECNWLKILEEVSDDECIGSRVIEWRLFIQHFKSYKRWIEPVKNEIFEGSKKSIQNNTNIQDKNIRYYAKALTGKTYNLSNMEDKELKDFGTSPVDILTTQRRLVDENNDEMNLKIDNHQRRLFYEKIAGFTCFYDTVFLFDKYITEPCLFTDENNIKKGTKRGLINMVSFLAEAPNIKNLIICSQDWWQFHKVGGKKDKNIVSSKEDVITAYINELRYFFNKFEKNIAINFYLSPVSIFKYEHERYIAFTQRGDYEEEILLDSLKDDYFIPLQLGQGFDYFADQNISAKVSYCTQNNFIKLIRRLTSYNAINSDDMEFKKKHKKYWQKEYGSDAKLYIHHKSIIRKEI